MKRKKNYRRSYAGLTSKLVPESRTTHAQENEVPSELKEVNYAEYQPTKKTVHYVFDGGTEYKYMRTD